MFTVSRAQVYAALDSERDYQQLRWPEHFHSITEYLTYMRDYIEEALHIESRQDFKTADPMALEIVRKVATLGVACMQEHGAPLRQIPESIRG